MGAPEDAAAGPGANGHKLTRNAKKRRRKKQQRQEQRQLEQQEEQQQPQQQQEEPQKEASKPTATAVEYVPEKVDVSRLGSEFSDFKGVFERFAEAEQAAGGSVAAVAEDPRAAAAAEKDAKRERDVLELDDDDDNDGDDMNGENNDGEDEDAAAKTISNAKRKKLSRFTVAELKQIVSRPDLVEAHDPASPDPVLLLHLKSSRSSVAVPRHWAALRKFLQGKRGLERVAYKLPDFIAETGINKIRAELAEQEAAKQARAIARDRVAPKLGVMDIDYQVLHDAFFKHQTKPVLKGHGEIYYEGMEYEMDTGKFRPGVLSPALRKALDMGENSPPPWLFNMQRHGPPPSYPGLRVPGVNAPLPAGARFGFHEGGWGKAPVDQFGRPLFGEGVFAQTDENSTVAPNTPQGKSNNTANEAQVNGGASSNAAADHWGEAVSDDDYDDDDDEDDGENEDEDEDDNEDGEENSGDEADQEMVQNAETRANNDRKRAAPTATERAENGDDDDDDDDESGPARKQARRDEKDHGKDEDKSLYTVIEQKQTSVGNETFATAYKYKLQSGATDEGQQSSSSPSTKTGKEDEKKTNKTGNASQDREDDDEDDADDLEQNFKF
ncbi:Splicing factor 3B subunit 2 [Hondaea fermentalgiana]|uniref:Splicing factor 3B subunit 2 n=1 Tax=Hondaea fermentalgiana TaxID=2315210 RepID=A0A2R5G1H3_9STRA|nr:Splicing factor 3B subunit 2 [Hondaea fermentalgiana]|eukprot:GBG24842.1 Splicing factor 3B subunit 2 [Hondaea fermentalgiana]